MLLNCAYLGIFKTNQVMQAAGLGDFSGTILIVFGSWALLLSFGILYYFLTKEGGGDK